MAGPTFHRTGMFSTGKTSNLVLLYHVSIFAATFFIALVDMFVVERKKPASMYKFGGRWRYLTVWNLDVQVLFFGMSLVYDAMVRRHEYRDLKKSNESKLRKLVSTFYAAIVYPLGMFVSVTFWILYAVDRELVFPRTMDQYVPSWVNHCLHTNIVLYILVEMWLVRHDFPSVKIGLSIVTMFVFVYFIWVHFLYYMSGVWVYPILQKLPGLQRYLFIASVVVSVYPIYLSGYWLHRKRWGSYAMDVKKLSG